jgi:3-hydroxyisobutyrate dehydrogenase-like beta-hydroxyacid dehydrogenase
LAETHFLLYRADNHFGNFHLLSSWRNRSIRADLLNAKLSRRRVKGGCLRSGATRGKTRSVAGWRLAEGKMRVGFIGLGMMGKGMAANLQKAGHDLVVHDLSRAAAEPFLAKGAVWANSPKQVGEQSEVVFTSLPVPADVEQVALGPNGLIEGMRPDTAFFDMSTNSVATVRKIHAAFAEKNLYMLDSPVSGGPSGAASGKMAIWVGGDEQQFNRHKLVLDAMGDQAAYIGPIGAGSIAKLVHNCTSAVLGAALAEVFTMGVKAGVDPVDLWAAVRQGATGRVRTFDRLGDKFLQGKHDPADFALRLLHKDVGLAVGLGREVGVPMRLANLVYEELTEAMNRGWGTRNSTVGQLLQVERAGIPPLAADPERVAAVREADKEK